MFYRGENQKIPRSLRLPVDCIAFQLFRPLCFLSPLLLPGAMMAQQITESEVRRLTLAPVYREWALRAVAPCITNVVRLEKKRDFGGV